ncbi:ABC transporter ATP-binding protein [uncultured Shewanella sp.]|uniref:ABC transporter ATP-binding protein n=1 Tax=uncultured Shewanella sp. TaxID=173975 RepID=UPI0026302A31|nr:ABC transporter ATP-binding protein [uncultured Shewanella sp.]
MKSIFTPNYKHDNALLNTKHICQTLVNDNKQVHQILDNINFTLYENEIVAILGKSGAGKSTFLRTISGLLPPSSGHAYYRNKLINKPIKQIAMVFQNIALLPWLTVLENVQFGLDAQGIPKSHSKPKALEALRLVGLAGYEHAYTKELSGGMRQRVGFARAFVVEPEILFMDEPFSSLDIYTANLLRKDIIELWQDKAINTRSMLMVTHSVKEAVDMANRIIIFDHDPGRIAFEMVIDDQHPRDLKSIALQEKMSFISHEILETAN